MANRGVITLGRTDKPGQGIMIYVNGVVERPSLAWPARPVDLTGSKNAVQGVVEKWLPKLEVSVENVVAFVPAELFQPHGMNVVVHARCQRPALEAVAAHPLAVKADCCGSALDDTRYRPRLDGPVAHGELGQVAQSGLISEAGRSGS